MSFSPKWTDGTPDNNCAYARLLRIGRPQIKYHEVIVLPSGREAFRDIAAMQRRPTTL